MQVFAESSHLVEHKDGFCGNGKTENSVPRSLLARSDLSIQFSGFFCLHTCATINNMTSDFISTAFVVNNKEMNSTTLGNLFYNILRKNNVISRNTPTYIPLQHFLDQISFLGYYANSADPVQTPTNAASDQSQHGFAYKNFNGKYSQLSLSRLRLSRITAYLEEKIWSLF